MLEEELKCQEMEKDFKNLTDRTIKIVFKIEDDSIYYVYENNKMIYKNNYIDFEILKDNLIIKNNKIGYTRVSQQNQDYNNQIIQLKKYNSDIKEFVNEKISSGKKLKERKLFNLINSVEEHSEIFITNLDRLARNVSEIEEIIKICQDRNIIIHITKIGVKLEKNMNPISKMFIQMLSSFAEMEKQVIMDRIKDGTDKARLEGKTFGRPKGKKSVSKLEPYKQEIIKLVKLELTPKNITKILSDRIKITEMTVYNYIKNNNLKEEK